MNITEARTIIAKTSPIRVRNTAIWMLNHYEIKWLSDGNLWASPKNRDGALVSAAELIKVAKHIKSENAAVRATVRRCA